VINCPITGVIIRRLTRHQDARGWLTELFRTDELPGDLHPVMAYLSTLLPGATRGPHEHKAQSDHFVLLGPSSVRLYLWDNRPDSVSRGQVWEFECAGTESIAVVIPPGVVHAYKNVGPLETIVVNAPNRLYGGKGGTEPIDEIRHEDDPHSPFRVP